MTQLIQGANTLSSHCKGNSIDDNDYKNDTINDIIAANADVTDEECTTNEDVFNKEVTENARFFSNSVSQVVGK